MSAIAGTASPNVSRLDRFDQVASTQDVVRDWLADGVTEVCLAVADVQAAGRGRLGRRWQAPPGRALLVSAGFRPTALPPGLAWRLPAIVSLAMLEAMAKRLGPSAERLALKWPNDLVWVAAGQVRKLGGVVTEVVAEADRLTSAIVGMGVNVQWPAAAYPPGLADTMGSLSEAAGRPVDRDELLDDWLRLLLPAYASLLAGAFDMRAWAAAQVTTGARVEVDTGRAVLRGTATGVDEATGALLLRVGHDAPLAIRHGDVVRCRVRPSAAAV